jgi:hypothetical protein
MAFLLGLITGAVIMALLIKSGISNAAKRPLGSDPIAAPHGPVPAFDGLDGVLECFCQDSLADSFEHKAEDPASEILAFAHDFHVDAGRAVGPASEGVGVAEAPPNTLESVVIKTTRSGSDQS